jgi:hypothetical protein
LKRCDTTGTKGFKFGKTWLKPVLREWSHKFLNVRTGQEVLSKRKNCITLVYTSTHDLKSKFGSPVLLPWEQR